MKRMLPLAVVLLLGCQSENPAPSARALELRQQGLAQLENEDPAQAEQTYLQLLKETPADPLPYANLAVSTLRQQRHDEALKWIDQALGKAPDRGDLLALRGDVLQWAGRPEEALAAYEEASRKRPEDPEILYSLYRQASSLENEAAGQVLRRTVEDLSRLRPENVVVILAEGRAAVLEGDRAAATAAFLRIRELLWQAPEAAERALEIVLDALEAADLSAARTPAQRLENVLKVTPMYREGLRELMTGVQGLPVFRFSNEPPSTAFGQPTPIRFVASQRSAAPVAGRALATADFDGDGRPDLAWVEASDPPRLQLSLSGNAGAAGSESPGDPSWAVPAGVTGLTVTDLDNDGHPDLLAYGVGDLAYWAGDGAGGLRDATAELGLEGLQATAAASLDFDIEGDLDLALGAAQGLPELLVNNLEGALRAVGERSFPTLAPAPMLDLVAGDLDRDGDVDLLAAREDGLLWLDNLRQGHFQDRSAPAGLAGLKGVQALALGDLDGDGRPEIVAAGNGLVLLRQQDGRFSSPQRLREGSFSDVLVLDLDNDGRLDLAAVGEAGSVVLLQRGGQWESLTLDSAGKTKALAAADLDSDGDLDLLGAGEAGIRQWTNQGAEANHWLAVRLRGIDEGNSKNNLLGLGATIEVFAGDAYQFREVSSDVTHFGLGQEARGVLLRVVWTNGVPQNRFDVSGNQSVVETQVLKGSCPFLYAWDGEGMAFVTDLLWGAPLGMPVAPGVWAGADPSELVRVDGARPRDGRYELRITEELWEAAYFDAARLWVVDHPGEVEVASSLKILLGQQVEDRVLGSRALRPATAVWDGRGREVTARVAARDEVYADGYEKSPYQGVAQAPWNFTFDLGEAPGRALRLHLDGWIFPADASLNLALAQRQDLAWGPPRLEVKTAGRWQVLMPVMPFPAGKTKTLVVDTPPLPPGARLLRIVTTQWLSWDRLAWTVQPADDEPQVQARLEAQVANLRRRGYSALVRQGPNAPHSYDYQRVHQDSPWLPMAGPYTRLGDVRELLARPDDRSVILAPGDEIALVFDARSLPPVPEGWRRTLFLESHGWDKDADRNTYAADQVEPLPFRAMSGYPYGPGESFPETQELETYRRQWLTRY